MWYERSFVSLDELTAYVNDESIVQANIKLIKNVEGRWHLVWWA